MTYGKRLLTDLPPAAERVVREPIRRSTKQKQAGGVMTYNPFPLPAQFLLLTALAVSSERLEGVLRELKPTRLSARSEEGQDE